MQSEMWWGTGNLVLSVVGVGLATELGVRRSVVVHIRGIGGDRRALVVDVVHRVEVVGLARRVSGCALGSSHAGLVNGGSVVVLLHATEVVLVVGVGEVVVVVVVVVVASGGGSDTRGSCSSVSGLMVVMGVGGVVVVELVVVAMTVVLALVGKVLAVTELAVVHHTAGLVAVRTGKLGVGSLGFRNVGRGGVGEHALGVRELFSRVRNLARRARDNVVLVLLVDTVCVLRDVVVVVVVAGKHRVSVGVGGVLVAAVRASVANVGTSSRGSGAGGGGVVVDVVLTVRGGCGRLLVAGEDGLHLGDEALDAVRLGVFGLDVVVVVVVGVHC
ncbi:hypothetical protein BDZ88DRAFT_200425 [Geranomyces variabilis]|nr:hypothetical protein BDZ88DRAFT_200425 [Geranomyces variabilis]